MGPKTYLKPVHEVVCLLKEVEGVHEDYWHFAGRQVTKLLQEIQDHDIPRNQGARESWPLKAVHSVLQCLQCAFLHSEAHHITIKLPLALPHLPRICCFGCDEEGRGKLVLYHQPRMPQVYIEKC